MHGPVACIGAGLIGTGWATCFAARGYAVRLQDSRRDVLEAGLKRIYANLKFLAANRLLDPAEVDAAFEQVEVVGTIAEAVADAVYVQESVYDDLELKRAVFAEMDAAAPAQTVLASSSSGLLMTDIQQGITKPERCVLAHPFLPVHLIPLVEVVGGARTAALAVRRTAGLMEVLGKTVVVLKKEVPGYIVNRLQAALLREAIDLVHRGVASAEDVDRAFCRGCGLRDAFLGPLLRAHLAGNSIENFLERYAQSYHSRWKTMAAWTSVPPSAAGAVREGVREMRIVREKGIEDLKNWRDRLLVRQLGLLEAADECAATPVRTGLESRQ